MAEATPFPFRILTPGGEVLGGEITQVEVRSYVGSLGLMAGHEPIVVACPAGTIRVEQDGAWVRFKSDPFILAADGRAVTVLTSDAQYSG